MNKKIIIIFIATIIGLGTLWAYSFGPLSGKTTIGVNPDSLKSVSQENIIAAKAIPFSIYHNKDLAENFYTIKFPQAWKLSADNKKAGSYQLAFDNGSCGVELMDIADNTTLELIVLSQQEPSLKKLVTGYGRIDYKKNTVDGNDAYNLIYKGVNNGVSYETEKIYISGKDHAAVLTLTAPQVNFSDSQKFFNSVVGSFQWENK
jgi:hypothetical protein